MSKLWNTWRFQCFLTLYITHRLCFPLTFFTLLFHSIFFLHLLIPVSTSLSALSSYIFTPLFIPFSHSTLSIFPLCVITILPHFTFSLYFSFYNLIYFLFYSRNLLPLFIFLLPSLGFSSIFIQLCHFTFFFHMSYFSLPSNTPRLFLCYFTCTLYFLCLLFLLHFITPILTLLLPLILLHFLLLFQLFHLFLVFPTSLSPFSHPLSLQSIKLLLSSHSTF